MKKIERLLRSRILFPALSVGLGLYYTLIITGARMALWGHAIGPGDSTVNHTFGFVFNDMLLRMLHGDFTSDPVIISFEAVFWDGKTYTYFGVMPALLRGVLLPFVDLSRIDVSPLSMCLAALLAVLFKVDALRTMVLKRANSQTKSLAWAFLAILLFAGAPLQYLKLSIYQETIMWESVFASAFLALAIRGLVDKAGFTARRLSLLALSAGCSLLTRPVMAIGLYAALLFLLLYRRKKTVELVFPVLILAMFASAAGFVNQRRFGNPLIFHHPERTLLVYPQGPRVLNRYGAFNLRRIPYGLMYYLAPVWFIHGGDGEFLFGPYRNREVDLVEGPPSTFPLSDTLLVIFAVAGVLAVLRRGRLTVDRARAGAIACGLAMPPLLMLTAYAMAFRYRMEFYPLLEFLALLGAFGTVPAPSLAARPRVVAALAVYSVLVSHVLVIAYKITPWGSLDKSQDLGQIYLSSFRDKVMHRHDRFSNR